MVLFESIKSARFVECNDEREKSVRITHYSRVDNEYQLGTDWTVRQWTGLDGLSSHLDNWLIFDRSPGMKLAFGSSRSINSIFWSLFFRWNPLEKRRTQIHSLQTKEKGKTVQQNLHVKSIAQQILDKKPNIQFQNIVQFIPQIDTDKRWYTEVLWCHPVSICPIHVSAYWN